MSFQVGQVVVYRSRLLSDRVSEGQLVRVSKIWKNGVVFVEAYLPDEHAPLCQFNANGSRRGDRGHWNWDRIDPLSDADSPDAFLIRKANQAAAAKAKADKARQARLDAIDKWWEEEGQAMWDARVTLPGKFLTEQVCVIRHQSDDGLRMPFVVMRMTEGWDRGQQIEVISGGLVGREWKDEKGQVKRTINTYSQSTVSADTLREALYQVPTSRPKRSAPSRAYNRNAVADEARRPQWRTHMSKFIINTVGVGYVPAWRSDDGMTETVAHFCATCPLGDNPLGLSVVGVTEEEVVHELREKYAEAINAGTIPGGGDPYNPIHAYHVDTGRIIRTGYPEDLLQKAINDEQKEAQREENQMVNDRIRKARQARYEQEKAIHLGCLDLKGISIHLQYDGRVKVWGISRYNQHTRRSEMIFRTRVFPRGKNGSWNWTKIRDHVLPMVNYFTAQQMGESAQANVRKQAEEITQRLGFDKWSHSWEPGQKNVHLNVYVPVDKLEEVVLAIRALGITLK